RDGFRVFNRPARKRLKQKDPASAHISCSVGNKVQMCAYRRDSFKQPDQRKEPGHVWTSIHRAEALCQLQVCLCSEMCEAHSGEEAVGCGACCHSYQVTQQFALSTLAISEGRGRLFQFIKQGQATHCQGSLHAMVARV